MRLFAGFAVLGAFLTAAAIGQQPTFSIEATSKNGVPIAPTSQLAVAHGDVIRADVFLRDWSGVTAAPLKGYQWTADYSSFFSGSAGNVLPRVFAGTTDLNGKCSSGGSNGNENLDNSFIDANHPQFVHAGPEKYYAVDSINCGYRFGSVVAGTGPTSSPGVKRYVGTMILEVSADAAGSFVVGLDNGTKATFLRRAQNEPILPVVSESLRLDVPSALRIESSIPPHNSIDSRQPSNSDGSNPTGYMSIVLNFNAPTGNIQMSDLTIFTDPPGPAPTISSITPAGNSLNVQFGTFIPPGKWTYVRYDGGDGPSTVRIGYLSGDVDNNKIASPLDILRLIDSLNNVIVLAPYQTDINRSGQTNPQDILAEIDVLNGAGALEQWNGRTLPP